MSQQGHNPIAIANEFIEMSKGEGVYLTKLLKLCYVAHGFTLAILHKPLADEYVQAWEYGPVLVSIYHEFKHMGHSLVRKKGQTLTDDYSGLTDMTSDFSPDERDIIRSVFEGHRGITAQRMTVLTHADDGPWAHAWKEGKYIRGYSISNDLIKKYYEDKIAETKAAKTQKEA